MKLDKRPVIYQMMTRLFGNTNSTNQPWGSIEENGVGKFSDINDNALRALKKAGYTHVWYTGVIEHAVLTDYSAYGIPLDDADVVKGRAGSPYAIKDYYDVNPDLADEVDHRMQEFEALVRRTHQNDLRVIIDFVPNHVARRYASDRKPEGVRDFGEDDDPDKAFDPNNNFYYLPGTSFEVPEGYQSLDSLPFPTKDGRFDETPARASGNNVFKPQPSVHDWFETVKLNYGIDYQDGGKEYFDPIPDTWTKTRDILRFWAGKGVDGFRCDMAEMVPVRYWQWVTDQIRREYPNVIFIAEIYNPALYRDYIHTGGFDFLYDKVELYDTLKRIIRHETSTDALTAIWQNQEGIGAYMLRFLENHDEQRIASSYFAGDPWKGIPMMAATAFMHSGPVMMYFGQDVGEPGAGFSGFGTDDGRTTLFDYWGVPEHIKWVNEGAFDGGLLSDNQLRLQAAYSDILRLVNESEAIREGSFYDLHYFNRNENHTGYSDQVYAFLRYKGTDRKLIIINFGESRENASLKIPQEAWEAMNLTSKNVLITNDHILINVFRTSSTEFNGRTDIPLTLAPVSYQILNLTNKK